MEAYFSKLDPSRDWELNSFRQRFKSAKAGDSAESTKLKEELGFLCSQLSGDRTHETSTPKVDETEALADEVPDEQVVWLYKSEVEAPSYQFYGESTDPGFVAFFEDFLGCFSELDLLTLTGSLNYINSKMRTELLSMFPSQNSILKLEQPRIKFFWSHLDQLIEWMFATELDPAQSTLAFRLLGYIIATLQKLPGQIVRQKIIKQIYSSSHLHYPA